MTIPSQAERKLLKMRGRTFGNMFLPKLVLYSSTQNIMPSDPITAGQPTSQPVYENYVVLAPDMAFYNEEDERFDGYHVVAVSAQDTEDALELASSALEEGCVPFLAFSAAELREMAADLCARELPPGRSYNLSLRKTDEAMTQLRKDQSGAVAS